MAKVKNLQNVKYQHGHIDWSFDSNVWFDDGSRAAAAGGRALKTAMWFLGDDEDGPMVVCIDIPPNTTGHVTPAHSHASDQVRIILTGAFRIGNDWYGPGDIRFQEAGKIYGPEEAGPEGSRQILIFNKRSGVAANDRRTGINEAGLAIVKYIAEMSKADAV
jgi:hypothetical protein